MGKKKKFTKPQQRLYAGAVRNRLNSDWIASSTSADSEIWSSLRTLRDRSRSLCRDNDYAIGAVRTILSNVLGENGIKMQSKVKLQRGDRLNDPLNKTIEELWKRWQSPRYCDVGGRLAWPQLERLALRSVVESGEVLIRKVPHKFEDSPVPFALQVIESDQLADDYSLSLRPAAGNVVKMGVELDQWERPVAYWVYPYHPGDQLVYTTDRNRSQPIRVPAEQIVHLYLCDRPSQTRGVPWFAAAINRLRHMGGYEEAEIIKARAHACAMGFIQSPEPGAFGDPQADGSKKQLGFEAGTIHTLEPGEVFQGFAPTSPNQALDPFLRFMLRGVSAGIGVPSDALSMDYSQTTYGGQRAAMLDARDYWGVVQQWLWMSFHQIIFESWMDAAVVGGAINLPGYEANTRSYNHPAWMPRGWTWIDPSIDVSASVTAITNGLSTLGRELAAQGLDFEELLQDRQREVDRLKKAKISFEIYPETMPSPAPAQPKEGLAAVRSTEEWAQYFTEALNNAQNEDDKTLVFDHWARCIKTGEFSELPPIHYKIFALADGLAIVRPEEGLRAAKKCKAKPCGNTCIATSKACLQGLSIAQKKLAQSAQKSMNASGAAVSSPIGANPAVVSLQQQAQVNTAAQYLINKMGGTVPASLVTPKAPVTPTTPAIPNVLPNVPTGASARALALQSAVQSRDFDTVMQISSQIYRDGKNDASDAQTFYAGIRAGNSSIEDFLLKRLYKEFGYDGKPEIKTSAEVEKIVSTKGKTPLVMYRAVGSSTARFQQHFDNFKNGDYYAGHGIYGHGTYIAGTKTLTTKSKTTAALAAVKYGSGAIRMALKPGSNIVNASKVESETDAFINDFRNHIQKKRNATNDPQKLSDINDQYRRTKAVLYGDNGPPSGRFAVVQGYDVIKLSAYNKTYHSLLNRSAVIVQETEHRLGDP